MKLIFPIASRCALDRPYQHREIGAAVARAHQRVDLLLDGRGGRQRQPRFLRKLQYDRDVLVVQTRVDAGPEVTPHHALAEALAIAAAQLDEVQEGLFLATDNDVVAYFDLIAG